MEKKFSSHNNSVYVLILKLHSDNAVVHCYFLIASITNNYTFSVLKQQKPILLQV